MSASPRPDLPWRYRVVVVLARWLVRALGASWRVNEIGREGVDALRAEGTPFIFVIWHGELLPGLWAQRDERISVLISEHQDGEIIAQVAEGMGYAPSVRGSSSRGAARALLQLVRTLQGGTSVGVTPDGPRGPAKQLAGGAVLAAQRSGAPMIALRSHASSAWRFRSWDRFMVPKPFARVTLAYGPPTPVPPGDAAVLEASRVQLQQLMADVGRQAGDAD